MANLGAVDSDKICTTDESACKDYIRIDRSTDTDTGEQNVTHELNVTLISGAATGGAVFLICTAIATYFVIKKVKCRRLAATQENEQELKPLKKIGKPIPIQDFRRSSRICVPEREEFDDLNRVDGRENRLILSQEAGMAFLRSGIPLNRLDYMIHGTIVLSLRNCPFLDLS